MDVSFSQTHGLAAVCFLRTKVRVWYFVWFYVVFLRMGTVEIPVPAFVALWAIWEVVQGLVSTYTEAALGAAPGVAHWAHVGGFAVGLVGALALRLRGRVVRGDLVSGRRGPTQMFQAYEQAGELTRLVEEFPQNADAWYALARAWEICGQTVKAGEAYQQAMTLFLRQRRMREAVRAYRALKVYGAPASRPDRLQFDLACALEETGHAKDAFAIFRQIAVHTPAGPQGEIALVRAGEIARTSLGDAEKAGECYRALLEKHPNSRWRALVRSRLRELESTTEVHRPKFSKYRPDS